MSLKETEKEVGTFELDESYFGAKRGERQKGKRSCWKKNEFLGF